jgi:hypothetical protein
MVHSSKIYIRSKGTQKIHIKGRGFGSVLLNTGVGSAGAEVNGASPPDMSGYGMMSQMRSSVPSMKKMKNIVF